MTHLGIWNTSYGQKKGWESNWELDSWPLKVRNRHDFVLYKWLMTYRWKDLDERYNFALDLISIRGLHIKLWAPKVARVLVVRILGLPFGNPKTKCHLDASPMASHRVYFKGEGGGFPQVWAVVSFVSSSLPMVHLTTKSAPTMH
jgi:hypothetical protein